MFEWSDLRVLTTVHRTGSLSAAAGVLRIDQTTVGRRLSALEAALGARLFHRGRDGLRITRAGDEVLAFAGRMEEEALALERAVQGRDRAASGPVRLTTLESFGSRFLAPRLGALRAKHPGVVLDVHTDNRSLSLTRREADLAVRYRRPEQPGLLARRVGALAYAAYASPAYLAAAGRPRRPADLARHAVLGYDDELAANPEARWLASLVGPAGVAGRSNSVGALAAAAAAGAGIAALPCFVGDADAGLERVLPPAVTRDVWLVVHPELRDVGRVRAVMEFVSEAVAAAEAELLGR